MTQDSFSPIKGKCLRIFLGEAEAWQGKPLYQVVVQQAQQQGMLGATVLRGIEGFGPSHLLSTDRLPDISDNLPIIIEIVDRNERIEAFLPLLDRFVQRGMITSTPVDFFVLVKERTRGQ
jgi:PII-like signaling protein